MVKTLNLILYLIGSQCNFFNPGEICSTGADPGGCERCLSHGQIFRTIFTGLKFQYKYVNEDKSIITL